MGDTEESVPPKVRTLMRLRLDDCGEDGTEVCVDHVYLPEGTFACDDCGKPGHDPGYAGLLIRDGDSEASVLLTAEQALVVASRLQRAAALIYESEEDTPDLEREAARYAAASEAEAP